MATSSYYAYATKPDGTVNTWFRGKLVITDTAIKGKNASSITWKFYVWMTSSSLTPYKYNYGNKLTVIINGVTVVNSSNYAAMNPTDHVSEATALLWASGSVASIAHNADGSKSFAFQCKYDQTQSSTLDYLNISSTHTCNTIKLASTVAATSVDLGSPCTITVTRNNAAYTHTVSYSIAGQTGTVEDAKTTETLLSWTPPLILAQSFITAESASCIFTCTTYNGNTVVGTATCSAVFTLPTSIVPIIPENAVTYSFASANAAVTAYGDFVAGKSSIKVTVPATVKGDVYNATIKAVSVYLNGTTFSNQSAGSALPQTIEANNILSGNNTLRLTITNSRGRSATTTYAFTAVSVETPYIVSASAVRCTADGTASQSGTYIKLSGTPTCTSLNGNNTTTVQYQYKIDGGNYSSAVATKLPAVIGNGLVSAASNYAVKITVRDTVGESKEYTFAIADENVPFHIKANGKAMGIGRYAGNDNVLSIEYDVQIKDQPLVDFVVDEGTSGIWTYRKWNGGTVEMWGQHTEHMTPGVAFGGVNITANGTAASLPASLVKAGTTPYFFYALKSAIPTIAVMDNSGTNISTPTIKIIADVVADIVSFEINWYVVGVWK